MLSLRNINRVYRTDDVETTALNNVNLVVEQGEFVAIMGPSGCGKSTLLNLIGMLDRPDSGTYHFQGRDIAGISDAELTHLRKQQVGFIFQNFNLIDELTAAENVELALVYQDGVPVQERRERVAGSLSAMGVANRARHLPAQMSGGQQQRVAVARALVAKPPLLLADEPTGNLDSRHGEEIMDLLTGLNRAGTTIIMVTHSDAHAAYAHRVVQLFDGHVVAQPLRKGRVSVMNTSILQNYLLVAMRNLVRNPLYSAINIAGLVVGLTCCLLILLFVRDELSYDRWLPDADRIVRIESTFIVPGREAMDAAQSPGPVRAALLKDFGAEIEQAVRLFQRRPTVDVGGRQFNDELMEVDPEFFSVFALEFVAGSPEGALGDNHSLVLTETLAQKYFGATAVVGKTLTITREKPESYRITGVVRDIPRNSHLEIKMISRFDPAHYTDRPWVAESWTSVNTYTYLKLRRPEAVADVTARIKEFTDQNVKFDVAGIDNITPSDLLKFSLQPVARIHLHSSNRVGFKPGGNINTVYTFAAIALLILLIASVNFMNLATARSMQRAREVALRKVHGASRSQLVVQFIGESVLVTLLSLALAVAATWALLPHFNAWVDKQLALDFVGEPMLAGILLGLAVLVGIVAGLYPAFFLSRFQPAAVLKAGRATGDSGSSRLRAALVLVQFTISIGLIAATLVVYSQWRYARDIDLGFDKDRLLVISPAGGEKLESRQEAMRQELLRLPGLAAVARASDTPPLSDNNNTLVKLPDVPSDDLLVIETMQVDYEFFPALGVKPVAGRLFSSGHAADVMPPDADKLETPVSVGVVLNHKAVKRLGFADAQTAIGKTFQVSLGEDKYADSTVVGVVDDLHMRSIHDEITPTIFYAGDDVKVFYSFILRLKPGAQEATLAAIDRAWAGLYPEVPIQRTFVDEDFDKLYAAEEERVKMFVGFSGLAIFVACLGLFGLASFTADRRTREIGIRKVLGASNGDLVRLLLWQFSQPVLIANLLAWPVAWYFLQSWLNNFPYRVDLSPLPFAAAGLLALFIAWGTVLSHARRVAGSDAVVALRYE